MPSSGGTGLHVVASPRAAACQLLPAGSFTQGSLNGRDLFDLPHL